MTSELPDTEINLYFIYNLTKFNLIPVLILRCFGAIYFYKTDLRDSLLDKFKFSRVPDFQDYNEWYQLLEDYFFHFKALAPQFNISSQKILDQEVGNYVFNRTLTETEHVNQALFLLKKISTNKEKIKVSTLGFIDYSLIKSNEFILPELREFSLAEHRLLSLAHRKIFSFLYLAKLIRTLFFSKPAPPLNKEKYYVLIDGISEPLLNDQPTDSTHSWFSDHSIFAENQNVLYNSPCHSEKRVDHISLDQLTSTLSLAQKFSGTLSAIVLSIKCTLDSSKTQFAQNLCPIIFLETLVKKMELKTYVTSVSIAWPENIILHLMKNFGVKTTAWLYTDGEYYFMSNNSEFQDCNIRFSFSFFDQIFVWDSMMENHFAERRIEKVGSLQNSSSVVSLAPMTNSHYECLDLDPLQARKELLGISGEGLFIGVFDIPVMKNGPRQNRGVGPYIDLNSEESFWKGVYDLLNDFAHVRIIYKPKRQSNEIFHELSYVNKVLNEHKQRVTILSHLTSPFVAVQSSDIVLSTLITSPTFLGDYIGRKSYWYDPTKRGIYYSKHFPKHLVLQSYKDLKASVESFTAAPTKGRFKETIDIIKSADWG